MADPYSKYGGSIEDPYAKYGGKVDQPFANPSAPVKFQNADLQHGPLTNVAVGALKGLGNTTAGIGDLIHKIPVIGPKIIPASGQQAFHAVTLPQGTGQKVGHALEQTAEWLVPTGAEEKVAALLASHTLQAARVVVPAARLGTAMLENGLRNRVQGGSFDTGAMAGAIGTVATPVLAKAGAGLANIAMSPGKRLLKSLPEGVNIGKTVMENSTGVRPATIARQLGDKISASDATLSTLLDEAGNRGVTVPLTPARQAIASEMGSAMRKNSPDYIKDVGKVQDQLAYTYGPDGKPVMHPATPTTTQGAGFVPVQVPKAPTMQPVPLPSIVSPSKARAIRQGVDLSIGNWNPEAQAAIAPLQERVRGAIAGGIHDAVPGSQQLDQHMTNLIPAKDAAWNVSYNPSVTQSVFNRIGRPTGALAGSLLGAKEGYDKGGTGGAIAGGAIGLVLPEVAASPAGQMAMARAITSPIAVPLAKGIAVQIARPGVTPTPPPIRLTAPEELSDEEDPEQ
jgi:hypothetical protein